MTSTREPEDDATARRGMEGLIAAMRGRQAAADTVDVPPAGASTASVRDGASEPGDEEDLAAIAWRAMHVALSSRGEDEGGDDDDELAYLERGAGRLREPPRGRGVPGWLRRMCERGLRTAPESRFPSIEALLDALARGRARARTRKGLAAVGAVALLGLGGEGWRRWEHAQRIAACEASGAEVDEAWNDARRQAVRDALLATGASDAATTAEKVTPWLDRQAAAWSEARVEACLDAEVRGRWDAPTLERSLWCLDERRTVAGSYAEARAPARGADARAGDAEPRHESSPRE